MQRFSRLFKIGVLSGLVLFKTPVSTYDYSYYSLKVRCMLNSHTEIPPINQQILNVDPNQPSKPENSIKITLRKWGTRFYMLSFMVGLTWIFTGLIYWIFGVTLSMIFFCYGLAGSIYFVTKYLY